MKREEYECLVRRLEAKSIASPGLYKLNVRLFAALGYAYFTFLLILGIAMVILGCLIVVGMIAGGRISAGGAKIALFLILGFGAFVWTMLRAMWLRYPAPEGEIVTAENCPKLFEMIRTIEKKLQARPIDHVVVTSELNAAIAQTPRFGPFGKGKSYLILGLPLMQTLDPAEFRAVVAHEFGHYSGNHSAFAGRIYRSRITWSRFAELHFSQSEAGFGSSFVVRFLRWFFPRFDARAFVLARQNEYEADRCAAEIADADSAVRALVRINLAAEYADKEFWGKLTKALEESVDAPDDIYARYGRFLRAIPLDDAAVDIVDRCVKHPTDYSDTHPCLSDRAAALGREVRGKAGELSGLAHCVAGRGPESNPTLQALVPRPPERTSSEEYLGTYEGKLAEKFSSLWKQNIGNIWKENAGKVREGRERLAALVAEPPADSKALLEKALLVERFEDESAAIELYRQVVQSEPESSAAHFHLGRHLLARRDEEGLAHMEEAMRLDVRATPAACELAVEFLRGEGRATEDRPWLKRYDDFQELMRAAENERNSILPKDQFMAPSLPQETVQQIIASSLQEERVRHIWIIQKKMMILPEDTVHIVVVDVKGRFWKSTSGSAASKIAGRIVGRLKIDDVIYVIVPWDNMADWKKTVKRVPGAQVWSAAETARAAI